MTNEMDLLVWGANTYGQLGLGKVSEQEPTPISMLAYSTLGNINPSDIKSICGGGGHVLLLKNDGELYSCGWNMKGQLGYSAAATEFQKICDLDGHKIVQVACGWDFSAAVSDRGLAYVWGSNEYRQLGLANYVRSSVTPICLNFNNVKAVSCGLRHMAILLKSGKVLISGQGSKGQLGLTDDQGLPIKKCGLRDLVYVDNVASVACGQYYNVALTDDGSVIGWGSNKHGQLGADPTTCPQQVRPAMIPIDVVATDIGAGWTHTVLLNENGEIYNFGRNNYGQLGDTRKEHWRPQKINSEKVTQICVGSEHNLAVTASNKLLTWGWNEHGNCGTGHVTNVEQPQQILCNYSVHLIGSGSAHSFAIVK